MAERKNRRKPMASASFSSWWVGQTLDLRVTTGVGRWVTTFLESVFGTQVVRCFSAKHLNLDRPHLELGRTDPMLQRLIFRTMEARRWGGRGKLRTASHRSRGSEDRVEGVVRLNSACLELWTSDDFGGFLFKSFCLPVRLKTNPPQTWRQAVIVSTERVWNPEIWVTHVGGQLPLQNPSVNNVSSAWRMSMADPSKSPTDFPACADTLLTPAILIPGGRVGW